MNNTKKTGKNIFLLIITALIWGVAFVAQSEGGDAIGPYTFNFIRFLLGSVVLIPVMIIFDHFGLSKNKPETKGDRKKLWIAGISCAVALCIASNFQQVGINLGTEVGKAGFLTACYILIVPILGVFLKKKCSWNIWVGVVIAVIGLYLLCLSDMGQFRLSDILVFICAICFSFQIMLVDYYSPITDGLRLSCIQFFICGLLSGIPMLIFEIIPNINDFNQILAGFSNKNAWVSILYAGIMSSGVAYTLQIFGQKNVNPTVASMVMSLESVFSVLAGMIILGQYLSVNEIIGCVLIFGAIILAEIPVSGFKGNSTK